MGTVLASSLPVLALALASGCTFSNSLAPTSAAQDSAPPSRTPYDALAPYVPSGMESLMFLDFASEGIPERLRPRGEKEEAPKGLKDPTFRVQQIARPVRGLYAGRRFSVRGPGFGDHEGVEVYESEKEIPNLAEVMKSWREWQKESLGGVDAYSAPPELEGPLETWIAAPTKRILLVATRRAILEESLLRKGANLVSVLASMGCERAIDWKSPVVIVRRYDAENEADIYSPLNTKAKGIAPMTRGFNVDGLLLEYRAGEAPGLRAWVRTEEPESSRRYFEELLWPKPDAGSSPDLLSASPSAPGEILLEGTFPASVPPGLPLVLFMAFGLNFVL